MKTINKLSIILIVCSLMILSWHTTALSHTDTQPVSGSDSASFVMPDPPGAAFAGQNFFINLSVSNSATITFVKLDEPGIGTTVSRSTSFGGGTNTWEFPFDNLGLLAGKYEISESISGALSGTSLFVDFPGLDLSATFDTWTSEILPGATITVEHTVNITSAGTSGDFSMVGTIDSPPPSYFTMTVSATRDIPEFDDDDPPKPIPGTNIVSYGAFFYANVTKTTTITGGILPLAFTHPTSEPTYAVDVNECEELSFTVAAADGAGNPADNITAMGELPGTPEFDGSLFSWTPPEDTVAEGTQAFYFTFIATKGDHKTLDVTVIVHNVPPPDITADGVPEIPVDEGTSLSFTVSAVDGDDNPVPVETVLSAEPFATLGATFDGSQFSWPEIPWEAVTFDEVTKDYTFTFTATLTIGECVLTTPLAVTITVNDVPKPPELSTDGFLTYEMDEGEAVEFTVTAIDPDGDNANVTISMDSDIPPGLGATFTPGTGAFSWSIPFNAVDPAGGTFTVTFNAIDEDEQSAEPLTVTITVTDVPLNPPEFTAPDAEAPYEYDAGEYDEGESVTFNVTAINPNLPDVPGEVTIVPSGEPVGLGATLIGDEFSWDIPANAVNPPDDSDLFTVTLTATITVPGEILTSTLTVTIMVNNFGGVPPQFVEVGPQEVKELETLRFTVVANYDRAFTITHSGDSFDHGATFDPGTGVFEWTPDTNTVTPFPLTAGFTATFTATDDIDGTLFSTMNVTITVEDVTEITLTSIGDRDVNEEETLTIQLSNYADDPLGQTLTYSMNSIPGATLNSTTGEFQWTPPYSTVNSEFIPGPPSSEDFTVAFSVRAERGMEASWATTTVTVTDVNPPLELTASPEPPQIIDELQTLDVTLSAVDEEGEPLTFSYDSLPDWATFDAETGSFSYRPGIDTVTYLEGETTVSIIFSVTDNRGATDSITYNITVKDKPASPVLDSIAPQEVEEGQTVTVTLSATDADNDPSELFYSASIGTVTDSTWSYTPPLDTTDTELIILVTITVTDPDGNSFPGTFDLTVINFNPPPVMEDVGDQSVSEGDTLTVRFYASDDEGEHFTFDYSVSPAFPTGSGVTVGLNSETGLLSVAPDFDTITHPNLSQDFLVTAWATDDRGKKSNEVPFTVTIDDTNRSPELELIGNQTVEEGAPLTFTVRATDDDLEDTVTYEGRFLPSGADFNDATGAFSWEAVLPVDPHPNPIPGVTFFARDEYDGVDFEVINIAVGEEVNTPPVITTIGGETEFSFSVSESGTISLTVVATDDGLPEGSTLEYSAVGLPGGQEENEDGTFSAGTRASFDPATHTFTWTSVGYNRAIDSVAAGLYAVTFVVSDGELSESAVALILVSPTNRDPKFDAPVADVTEDEGERVTMHVSATDLDDDDELTLRVDGKPVGATIEESASWDLTWQTDYSVVSPPNPYRDFPMTFRVSDGTAEITDSAILRIEDVDLPPVIRTIGGIEPDVEFNIPKGESLNFAVVAFDPEGGPLEFSALGVPEALGASFDPVFGTFSWPEIPTEAEDTYTVTITVTDSAPTPNSTSALAIINTIIVVDEDEPNAPSITEILPASPTNSTDITVNGTAEARSIVSVLFDGTEVGSVKAKSDETFSVSISSVAEGAYSVTATATDAAKQTSDPSTAQELIVDPTPPVVTITSPNVIATPTLSADYDAGVSGLANVTAELRDEDGVLVATSTATGADTISVAVNGTLFRRISYNFKVTVGDLAGNSTTVSHSFTYNPDIADENLPTISGMLPTGIPPNNVINQKRPKISATFKDDKSGINSETISIGGIPNLGEIQYNSKTGEAFAYPTADLADGTYTATFGAKDNNGNLASDSIGFTVDTTGPDAPTPGAIPEFTPVSPITMTGGIAEPGSEVKLTVNGNPRGISVTANATTGEFTMADIPLTEGKNDIVFTATDKPTNNVGSPSSAVTCTFDTQALVISDVAPQGSIGNLMPTITALFTDSTELTWDVSGINADTISMTLDYGDVVDIVDYFDSVTGRLSYPITTDLVSGEEHTVVLSCRDNAGNPADPDPPVSITWTFTYVAGKPDTTPPTITGFSPADDALLNRAIGHISVYVTDAESGVNRDSIVMFVGGPVVGWTFDPDTGLLSYTYDFTGDDGEHTVTVSAEDNATNTNPGQSVSFTTDTGVDPPVLDALDSPTKNVTVNVEGYAEDGATVEIFQNGASIGVVSASRFIRPNVPLQEGRNTFTAIATDIAKNTSDTSIPVTVLLDREPPSIGNFAPDGDTNDKTPPISMSISDGVGSGVPDITRMELDYDEVTGFIYDEATGSLTYTPSYELSEGTHYVAVTVFDRAENRRQGSFDFVVDVTGPSISGFSPGYDEAIGNPTPSVSAIVSDDREVDASSVEMLLDGSPVGSYDPSTGLIQYQVTSPLDNSPHTITVGAMDIAGNANVGVATFIVDENVTDGTPPAMIYAYPADGAVIGATSYYVVELVLVDSDSGPAWETIVVTINDVDETDTIRNGGGGSMNRETGLLTIYPDRIRRSGPLDLSQLERPTGFARGQNTIQIRMADNAGNIMNKTLTFTVLEPPRTPILVEIPSPTNKETVAVTGNVPDASPSVQVTVLVNGIIAGTAPVDDAGNFTLEQAFIVTGTNIITAYASDSAGNRSVTSVPAEVLLDQTPPDVKMLDVMLLELPEATKTETLTLRAQFIDDSGLLPALFKLVLNGVEQDLPNERDVTLTLTLTEGTNTIVLHATDAAGNEAVPVSYEIELDTVGPETAPENLRASVDITGERIVLTWEADVNAATYNVYKNIQPITNVSFLMPVAANVSGTSWTDIDVVQSMTYYYAVASVDAAGNKGMQISNSPNVTLISATIGGMAAIADGTRVTFAQKAISPDVFVNPDFTHPILVAAVTIEALADGDVPSLGNAIEGSTRSVTATLQSGEEITAPFKKAAQLSIPYPATTESPENIRMFVLTDDAWKQVKNVNVIPELNLVMADIENFGIYRLAIPSLNPDVNGDGVVDILDLMLVSEHFGGIGPEGDANVDGIVDIFDLVLVGAHYGEKVSTE